MSTTTFTTRTSRGPRDEGSVLLLLLGGVVVLALLVAVVVDAARLYLARRAITSITDAAALAGAQGADLGAVYAGRGGAAVPLDPASARAAVARYLDDADAGAGVAGFALIGVQVGPTTVTVSTRATVRLPFVGAITRGHATVVVRASSSARDLRGP